MARSPFPHRQSLATLGPCIPQGACRLRGTGTSHYPRAHNPIFTKSSKPPAVNQAEVPPANRAASAA
ncbi:MAG: hypothetical protein ACK56F_26725, partial [bacterium]